MNMQGVKVHELNQDGHIKLKTLTLSQISGFNIVFLFVTKCVFC